MFCSSFNNIKRVTTEISQHYGKINLSQTPTPPPPPSALSTHFHSTWRVCHMKHHSKPISLEWKLVLKPLNSESVSMLTHWPHATLVLHSSWKTLLKIRYKFKIVMQTFTTFHMLTSWVSLQIYVINAAFYPSLV